jgi:hypothetical protein
VINKIAIQTLRYSTSIAQRFCIEDMILKTLPSGIGLIAYETMKGRRRLGRMSDRAHFLYSVVTCLKERPIEVIGTVRSQPKNVPQSKEGYPGEPGTSIDYLGRHRNATTENTKSWVVEEVRVRVRVEMN